MNRICVGTAARRGSLAALALCVALAGCRSTRHAQNYEPEIHRTPPVQNWMPRELDKVVMPPYLIEPPDILTIETVHAVPKSPYRLRTLDVLGIQVLGTLPDAPISGVYPIEPGGRVNLGAPYGTVKVIGLTVEEAEPAIKTHLMKFLREPEVSVSLAELGAAQQLVGEFLVGPDGTVTLGTYGTVSIVGKTVEEAKAAIEKHLSAHLEDPVISLRVFAFNSKVYYIVLQGGGLGDGIYRFPVTGNETVLDALAQINGLEQVSSKKIWIARPSRDPGHVHVLPVDYLAITEQAAPGTNYQLLPGDRVFIAEDKWVKADSNLAKVLTPVERLMGFSLLGAGTATRFSGQVLKGGGNPNTNRGGF